MINEEAVVRIPLVQHMHENGKMRVEIPKEKKQWQSMHISLHKISIRHLLPTSDNLCYIRNQFQNAFQVLSSNPQVLPHVLDNDFKPRNRPWNYNQNSEDGEVASGHYPWKKISTGLANKKGISLSFIRYAHKCHCSVNNTNKFT